MQRSLLLAIACSRSKRKRPPERLSLDDPRWHAMRAAIDLRSMSQSGEVQTKGHPIGGGPVCVLV
jgi:hypothetical protein